MKKLAPVLLLLLTLLSCIPKLYVSSDFDKTIDFYTYKTFAWAKKQEIPSKVNPISDNELNRKRIKEAIEMELVALGLNRFDWAPELLIDFHLTINQGLDYVVHDSNPSNFRYWADNDVSSYTYKKGALIIHMVDAKKGYLVWQGAGSSLLSDVPPKNVEEKIHKAVKAILAQYQMVKK